MSLNSNSSSNILTQLIKSDSTSLSSLSTTSTGKSSLSILDSASYSKVEASVSAANRNSFDGETAVKTRGSSKASHALADIIRKSNNVSVASSSSSNNNNINNTSSAATLDRDVNADHIKPSALSEGLSDDGKLIVPAQAVPPFTGTVLEGHKFTPTPAMLDESESAHVTEIDALPFEEARASGSATGQTVRTSSDSTNENRSSMSAFATWWSGGSTSALISTNADTSSDHKKPYYTPDFGLSPTTPTTPVSPSESIPNSETQNTMDWEPSGPEILHPQKLLARKDKSIRPASSSLPSSLPSSAAFPSSMIKHSKLVNSTSGRRGSTSSTQSSLTSLLWSKLAAGHDNITSSDISVAAKESVAESNAPVDLTSESNATDVEVPPAATSGVAIAPAHAKITNSPANSTKKRWSLFGYGARDDDDAPPASKLRRSGDVLIEPESRPASVNEAFLSPSVQDDATTNSAPTGMPLDSTLANSTQLRNEIVDTSDKVGPIAPPVVGTSEFSVVVPAGTAATKTRYETTSPPGATSTGTYSWLSIIPGLGSKTEDTSAATAELRASHQITDYEEGERKDVDGNTVKLTEGPVKRTLAELAEIRSAKEAFISKEELKDSRPEGMTFGQVKEKENQESIIVKETGKAVASLSKVIMRKKNMILPDYYEQYPDVRQSLLTLSADPLVSAEGSKHQRSPSIVKSAVNALSSLLFFKSTSEQPLSPAKDDVLHRGASKIKKVAIIGVHGWFPVKLIRTVIGEPTGTSKKFCDEMDLALRDYLKLHDVDLKDEDITLIPLEGEGKVMKRVEILYQNLVKNELWKKALHEADVILVATHSQGTPTSTLLVARLIKEGMLRVKEDDPRMQRIGILAMAGISHGPFPSLKGNLIVRWFEAEAAQELFEFMDSETEIARKYREALRIVLTSGIRFTVVASLEDQVVPLYSAVMTAIHHPSIVRAVYIDGVSFQDDFLTNLISFAMRLRNSGVDDHSVLVHLSEAVAGSIYGEGHSTIYEERGVYMLAIRALLEPPESLTSEMVRSEPILHPFRAKQNLNPFYLPWGMRGVMDELKTLGNEVLDLEMERLKKLYDEWNPVSKGMKEIKFRLEPVRSKL
ncbi:hypothetical protein BGZ98_005717 [Dissophora globulifera]|nr:hypothetical protein BGZ98_005717 [Dissophora globulifera]